MLLLGCQLGKQLVQGATDLLNNAGILQSQQPPSSWCRRHDVLATFDDWDNASLTGLVNGVTALLGVVDPVATVSVPSKPGSAHVRTVIRARRPRAQLDARPLRRRTRLWWLRPKNASILTILTLRRQF